MKQRGSLFFSLGCFTLIQGICLTSADREEIAQVIPDNNVEVNGQNNGENLGNGTRAAGTVSFIPTNFSVNVNNVFSSNLSSAFRIPSDTEIPMNLLESKQTFATVCQSKQNREQPSGLIINNQVSSSPAIAPIKTSIGDIYPARGIIKTVDGQVILTSYPTDEASTRKSNIYVECD